MAEFPLSICGRSLRYDDIELSRQIILSDPSATRESISRSVCRAWSWFKPDAGLKTMSCKVLLLKLHRLGLITLSESTGTNANGRKFSRRTQPGEAKEQIDGSLKSLLPLELERVTAKKTPFSGTN